MAATTEKFMLQLKFKFLWLIINNLINLCANNFPLNLSIFMHNFKYNSSYILNIKFQFSFHIIIFRLSNVNNLLQKH